LVLLALQEVATEEERLQGEFISVEQLEILFDAMNKARYYLHELESSINDLL
jgi:hypothetical protein